MSKGLEALERIGNKKYTTTVADITGFERITISVKQDNKKEYQAIEKALKALEIIKRQPFAFASLTLFLKDFDTYEKWEKINPNCFTKEEYDLLKEVLKDE